MFIMDAQAKYDCLRITAILKEPTDAISIISNWLERWRLDPSEVWYADVFSLTTTKRTNIVKISPTGYVQVVGAPEDDKLCWPVRRRRKLAWIIIRCLGVIIGKLSGKKRPINE